MTDWRIPVSSSANLPAFREAVNDALESLRIGDVGDASRAVVCVLDGSLFDGVTTFFADALPVAPDLTSPNDVVLLHSGVGTLIRVEGVPPAGKFALSGDGAQSITYGFAPEAGDWVVAIFSGLASGAGIRRVYLSGYVGELIDGEPFTSWVVPVACTFKAGLVGSYGKVRPPFVATSDATLPIDIEGVAMGSALFGAGDQACSFAAPADVYAPAGSIVTAMNPSPTDLTLRGVTLTLAGDL